MISFDAVSILEPNFKISLTAICKIEVQTHFLGKLALHSVRNLLILHQENLPHLVKLPKWLSVRL